MPEPPPDDVGFVVCRVLDVERIDKGKVIALATVEIDVEGIVLIIKGVQVIRE